MADWIRITRKFNFEAAHALLGYDGACKHIHGHSYILEVCLLGKVLEEAGNPKDGMVMDFGDLKKLVQVNIIEDWDHALLLHKDCNKELLNQLLENNENLVLLPYQPSCENMLLEIKNRLQEKLPSSIRLYRLMLSETAKSYAEWYCSDNEK